MGADYKGSKPSMLPMSGAGSTIAANTFAYFGLGIRGGAITQIEFPAPITCILSHLHCHAGGPAGAGETFTYTFYVGGNPTTLTCITGGAADQDSSDLANAVQITEGDLLCVRCDTSLNAFVTNHNATLRIT